MTHLHRGQFQTMAQKCIHVTNLSMSAHHHGKAGCIGPPHCGTYIVNRNEGYFLHYRYGWTVADQCKLNPKCLVKYDPVILKYKTRLENNMKSVLAQIPH